MEIKKTENPTLHDQEQFYDAYWSRLKPYGRFKAARVSKIVEYLSEIKIKRIGSEILDLGCGDGRSVAIWNIFGKATGLDLSPAAVAHAKKAYPGLDYFSGDALHTPFNNQTFDIIVSQEVIEHIEEQQLYIDECHRLLRDNGYLVLTTPNKYYFDRVKGGNYSKQPIEKIMESGQLRALVESKFSILKLESIVIAPADYGIYRLLFNKIVVALFRATRLDFLRKEIIKRNLLGLHLCVLARKK